MVFAHLMALAPALAATLVMLLVEGPPAWMFVKEAVGRKVSALRKDKPTLEVVAEALVHLSTYGSVLVAFMLDHAFAMHMGHLANTAAALLWFVLMLRLARGFRVVLHDLED